MTCFIHLIRTLVYSSLNGGLLIISRCSQIEQALHACCVDAEAFSCTAIVELHRQDASDLGLVITGRPVSHLSDSVRGHDRVLRTRRIVTIISSL